MLERGIPGGQLWNTAEVEDYPGFEHIMGPDLADRMQKHAEKFGATFETGAEVVSVSADGDDRVVRTADGREFRAPAVIVTAGGEARKLGVPGEEEFAGQGRLLLRGLRRRLLRGRGHRGRRRRRLRRRGGHLPHALRRQGLRHPPARRLSRAQPILVEQMRATGKVDEVMNSVVDEIHGTDGRVSHLTAAQRRDRRAVASCR